MDNLNLEELMDLAEAYVGPLVDAIYRRLMDRDFALEDSEVIMLMTALINILGHDNRGDRPTEILLMAAYGERGVLDRPDMRVMRWRNGLSQELTWRMSLDWEVREPTNQVKCLCPPSLGLD